MIQKTPQQQPSCRLRLLPDRAADAALRNVFHAYEDFLTWLDENVPVDQSNDLVVLHRTFYESVRARTGLPSQIVTLGFRDWVARRRGEHVVGVPLDARLYSIKNVSTVSVAGLQGRILTPFRVQGYDVVLPGGAPARLIAADDHFELWAEISPLGEAPATGSVPAHLVSVHVAKENTMIADTVVSRLGRLIAGMAHAAIDTVEGVQPVAVLEQAIREIDVAAGEVRVELGKATAERHRLQARRDELSDELRNLDRQLKVAVKEGRDDLAAAGIGRQLDIEAQTRILDSLIGEVDEKIAKATDTLDAVKASRREAEQRMYEFRQAEGAKGPASPQGTPTLDALSKAAARVERAENASARITGVPATGERKDARSIEALEALAREHAVKERLARLKADS